MTTKGPFVAVAAFSEKLLQESDGVLSLVRIVDTYHIRVPEKLPPGVVGSVEINGLVALKSGDGTGEHRISLVVENPVQERKTLSPDEGWLVTLNGGEHGVNLKLRFILGLKHLGLYWFDVLFDGDVLTRIPLKLLKAQPEAAK